MGRFRRLGVACLFLAGQLWSCVDAPGLRTAQLGDAERRDAARRYEMVLRQSFDSRDPSGTRQVLPKVQVTPHIDDFGSFTAVLDTLGKDGRLLRREEIAGTVDGESVLRHAVTRDVTPLAAGDVAGIRQAVLAELDRQQVNDAWYYSLSTITPCPGSSRVVKVEAAKHFTGLPRPDAADAGSTSRQEGAAGSGHGLPVAGTFDLHTRELMLVEGPEARMPPACPSGSDAATRP